MNSTEIKGPSINYLPTKSGRGVQLKADICGLGREESYQMWMFTFYLLGFLLKTISNVTENLLNLSNFFHIF